MNKQEKKNLDMVLDWWRVVIQGGHLDQAPKYQAEDYIQHNPNVNTGRAGFVEFFSKFSKPKNPIPDKLANPPVVMGAKGDYRLVDLGNRIRRTRAILRRRTTPTASTCSAFKTARCRNTGTAR